MTSEHIFDKLKENKPSTIKAFARIRYRYDHEEHIIRTRATPYDYDHTTSITVKDFIERFVFHYFPIQTTHIDLNDFLCGLGIRIEGQQSLDNMLLFIEYI